LRKLEESDAPSIQSLVSDRDVAVNLLLVPHPYPENGAIEWIRTANKHLNDRTGLHWGIERHDTPGIIGNIGLKLVLEHQRAEIGYWLGKPFWGRGYATEAALAVVKHGFETMGLNRMNSFHYHWNPQSGRVLAKIGMKHEGVQRRHILRLGQWADDVMLGMLKEDYFAMLNRK
jgi:RimJ/RimL family protein N-acetyltransferase